MAENNSDKRDLGAVTAYAEAVEGGYKGTYEEWCDLLANFGVRADEVKTNASAVAENKSSVDTALKEAQSAASEAEKSKQDASDYADNASSSAKTVAENISLAQTYASNSANSATEAKGYQDKALEAATNAAGYAGESEYRLMINPETGRMALCHYTADTATA